MARRIKGILVWTLMVIMVAGCDGGSGDDDFQGVCGDGIVSPGEECDGPPVQTCSDFGYYTGELKCSDSCHLDFSQCTGYCGDGHVQPDYEDCDGTVPETVTCASLGYHGNGRVTCTADCKYDLSACKGAGYCGDGVIQPDYEECDGTNLGAAKSCADLGYYGGELRCTDSCVYDVSDCVGVGRCGDGVIQAANGEECDGTNLGGKECSDFGVDGHPFHGGSLRCTDECTFDLSGCEASGYCGDGVRDATWEECDGTDLSNLSCVDLGFEGGFLACNEDCTIDTSGCCSYLAPEICNGRDDDCDGEVDLTCTGGAQCQEYQGVARCDCPEGQIWDAGSSSCVTMGFVDLDVGTTQVCAVTLSHEKVCWGYNKTHYLYHEPMVMHTDVVAVASGEKANFEISLDGRLRVTGWESSDGRMITHTSVTIHEPVTASSDWMDVEMYRNHGCAIDVSRSLWCWGNNEYHQASPQDDGDVYDPVRIQLDGMVSKSFLGERFSCAILFDGTVWCWGDNTYGELGQGTTDATTGPVRVQGLPDAQGGTGCGGARHACVVASDGTLWCWGDDTYGQVDGHIAGLMTSPVRVMDGVRSVGCGDYNTCAVKDDGTLWCWGHNTMGQLGLGTRSLYEPPTQVGTDTDWSMVDGEADTMCALKEDGTAWCWGNNEYQTVPLSAPHHVPHKLPHSFGQQVAQMDIHSWIKHVDWAWGGGCAVMANGDLYCWGPNTHGEVGSNDMAPHTDPVLVGTGFSMVSTGAFDNVCAIRRDGTLWCWGYNSSDGRTHFLPVGTDEEIYPYPQKVGDATDWVAVQMGCENGCALKADGTLWCWGTNRNGMVRDPVDDEYYDTPQEIPIPAGENAWTAFSVGWWHACGLTDSGSLWCWGRNDSGQVGQEPFSNAVSVPHRVEPPSGVSWVDVQVVGYSTCALGDDGKIRCWGRAGIPPYTTAEPVEMSLIPGFENVAAIRAVGLDVLAVLSDSGELALLGSEKAKVMPELPGPFGARVMKRIAISVPGDDVVLLGRSNASIAFCFKRGGDVYCMGASWAGELPYGGAPFVDMVLSPRPVVSYTYR